MVSPQTGSSTSSPVDWKVWRLFRTRAGFQVTTSALNKLLLSAFLLLCGLLLPANPASTRTVDNTLLILDASGSMWGRVEGRSKIETARDVIVDLLATNPVSQRLGLMSYGHRRKGDCTDIELLVPPAAGTSRSIQSKVMSIKPRGKTPLSASVIEAARTLRSEENKATVILVSDGRETCDYDPCQVARELEQSGVDFTAHMIGFNVTDPIDLSQLRCMADNTGGRFFKAENGEELSQALQSVSHIFNQSAARESQGAQQLLADRNVQAESQAEVTNDPSDNSTRLSRRAAAGVASNIDAGKTVAGNAGAGNASDNAGKPAGQSLAGAADLAKAESPEQPDNVDGVYIDDVEIRLSDSAYAGDNQMPNQSAGRGRSRADDPDDVRINSAQSAKRYQHDSVGNGASHGRSNEATARESVPSGLQDGRGLSADNYAVIEMPSSSVKTIDLQVKLTLPSDLYTQQVFAVRWVGPGLVDDLVTIALPESPADKWISAVSVSGGKKLKLTAPEEAGEYEVRYISIDRQILAAQKIIVRKAEAALLAPEQARSGRLVRIRWKGGTTDPRDSIVITRSGAPLSSAINRRAIRAQSSVMLLMPSRAGDYELRYIQAGGNLIGSKPIVVR